MKAPAGDRFDHTVVSDYLVCVSSARRVVCMGANGRQEYVFPEGARHPAGTFFETRWTKIVTEVNGTKVQTQSWFVNTEDGDAVLVKSVSEMTMAAGEQKTVMILVASNRL